MGLFNIFNRFHKKQATTITSSAQSVSPQSNNNFTSPLLYGFNSPSFGSYTDSKSLENFLSWVYVCVDGNAGRLAGADMGLYTQAPESFSRTKAVNVRNPARKLRNKILDTGQKFVKVVDIDHPIVQIINHPNELQNYYTFFYKTFAYLFLTGDAYWYKLRNESGQMTGMAVIDPRRIKAIVSSDTWQILGWTWENSGTTTQIPREDIIHVPYPSPQSDTNGYSPVHGLWDDLVISREKANSDLSSAKNSSKPSFAVMVKDADQDDLTRFKNAIKKEHSGTSNSGKFMVLDADQASIETLQFDGEVTGDPEIIVRKICAGLKYPYAKIISNEVNMASADTVFNSWMEDLEPLQSQVEDALNSEFITEFPELQAGSMLLFENLSKKDKEFSLKESTELFKNKIIDRHTAKTIHGLAAEDNDKDIYFDGNTDDLEQE